MDPASKPLLGMLPLALHGMGLFSSSSPCGAPWASPWHQLVSLIRFVTGGTWWHDIPTILRPQKVGAEAVAFCGRGRRKGCSDTGYVPISRRHLTIRRKWL